MKFFIEKKSKENITTLMSRARYHYHKTDNQTSEMVFTRPAGQDAYPRFHLYLKEDNKAGKIFISIHLDQRKTVYQGVSAHSGEYDGELLEKEVERLKTIL